MYINYKQDYCSCRTRYLNVNPPSKEVRLIRIHFADCLSCGSSQLSNTVTVLYSIKSLYLRLSSHPERNPWVILGNLSRVGSVRSYSGAWRILTHFSPIKSLTNLKSRQFFPTLPTKPLHWQRLPILRGNCLWFN